MSKKNKRPNIVLLIAEEMRADMLGYAGNKDVETPFLDNLSEQSVAFQRHYTVHSKCVPSRCALYSGRYPHCGGHRTLGIELQENEISLANLLKEEGYETILVQKNHTVDKSILMSQFDEHWEGGIEGKKPIDIFDYDQKTTSRDRKKGNKYADNYIFGKLNIDEKEHKDYLVTERTVDYIKNRKDKNKSFFINLNFEFTHTPYGIMEPYYSKYMNKELTLLPNQVGNNKPIFLHKLNELYGFNRLEDNDRKEMLACYYGMMNYIDNRVKEIYEALESSGELENTIFIFTSDHGDFVGQYGVPEKWDTIFYDCLLKVPLIIRYPKEFLARKIKDTFTENIDILPTLIDLLGIERPYGIQGESLVDVMKGTCKKHKDYVFAEGGHEKELLNIKSEPNVYRDAVVGYQHKEALREIMPDSLRKAKMIRTDKYKLVYRIKDRNELYDLEDDSFEMNNLYYDPKYEEIKNQMEKTLLNHLIEYEENLPFDPQPIS